MTIIEKTSKRKANAIRYCVEHGEYSPGYASDRLEELHDNGKILDVDYEPLAEWLEELINTPEETPEEISSIEETPEEEIEENIENV